MDFTCLEYIKNVNDHHAWAYDDYCKGAYFRLNFKRGRGVETHALNLPKGAYIILSQKTLTQSERHLTHVVELVNEGSEDKPQWETGVWGIFRWVKIHWITDFSHISSIPVDRNVMRANWGWHNTKAKSLNSPRLMSQWVNIDNLITHLKTVFS